MSERRAYRILLSIVLVLAAHAGRATAQDGDGVEVGEGRARSIGEIGASRAPRGDGQLSRTRVRDLESELADEGLLPDEIREDVRESLDVESIRGADGLDTEELESAETTSLPVGGSRSAATPQALSLPDGEGSIEGMGESFSPSLSTGALSFTVPLAVPAGRAGVTPTLALGYSSGGGGSEVGYGWGLGVAVIARQTDRGLPRYVDRPAWHPEEDHFVYAGSHELVPVDSARMTALDGGAVPAELSGWQQYRAQVEGGFMRFFRSPDSTRWVVQSPDGSRHDLGLLPAGDGPSEMVSLSSRSLMTDGGSRIASWALTRTSDVHGSTIYYVYDSHEGERYLSDIYYVSPATCAASSAAAQRRCSAPLSDYGVRVHLVYEGRPDPTLSYRHGWRVRSARRLRRIEITSAGEAIGGRTLVRRYHFGYEARSYHSLLSTLTVEGRPESAGPMGARVGDSGIPEGMLGDGLVGVTLPPMRFHYSSEDSLSRGVDGFPALDGARRQGASSPRDGAGDRRADLYDVNSDGLVDLLVTDPSRFRTSDGAPAVGVYFNGFTGRDALPAEAGTFSEPIAVPMPAELAGSMTLTNPNIVPMDVDGDGRSDLLHMPRAAEYGFFTPVRRTGNQASPAQQGWQFAYLPVSLDGELDPRVDLSRDAERIRVLDVNQDGLIDVVRTSGTAIQTWLNLGWYPGGEGRFGTARLVGGEWELSTQPAESCLPVAGPAVSFDDPEVRLADMNGDGLEDIVRMTSGAVVWWPNLGHGRFGLECGAGVVGSRPIEMRAPRDLGSVFDTTYLADIDGDGMSDLVRLGAGTMDVWFNMGGTAFSRPATVEGLRWSRDLERVVRFVDVDGSGTTDVLFARARQWEWVDPMGGRRPRLLSRVESGLGAESRFTYATSAEDYLNDLASVLACSGADCDSFLWQGRDDGQCDGRVPAAPGECLVRSTGAPSITTVIRATETSDRLSVLGAPEMTTRTEYYYHDGYYEGVEQEHRGFGATDVLSVGGTGHGSSFTRTRMHQGRRPRSIASDRLAINPWESLKGRTYLAETFDLSNGRASGATHTAYRTRVIATGLDGREIAWTFAERTDELRYDTMGWVAAPPGSRAPYRGPEGGDTYPAVSRDRVSSATVITPDSAYPGWRDTVPLRRVGGFAILASTVDATDLTGHVTRSTAWGRVQTEWNEPLLSPEEIVSRTEVFLLDPAQWIWRSRESWTEGHGSSERLRWSTITLNGVGDTIGSRAHVAIPRAFVFGGDADGSESFTQVAEDIVSTLAVDSWGQSIATCAGGTVESPASCYRYASVSRDPAYAQIVTSETVATGSGAGLTWTARFDRGLGSYVESTDPRGVVTSNGFDGFGRQTFVRVPPVRGCEGTTLPSSVVRYAVTTDPVSAPLSMVETTGYLDCHDSTDVAVSRAYVDGLGRPRAALTRTDAPHAWVRGGLTEYTPRGTAYRTYNASFLDAPEPSLAEVLRPSGAEESAYVVYDAFGRVFIERPMGATLDERTYHYYGALTHTVLDANNMLPVGTHVAAGLGTTQRMDGHGRVEDTVLRQRRELGMAVEHYRLWARYRADGALIALVRAHTVDASALPYQYDNPAAIVGGIRRVMRTFTYDSQGRRLASTDRDTDARRVGATDADRTWRYLWNRVGDLVAVRDPRGCGQNFYYDRAGRLLGEDYVSCAEAEPWRDLGGETVPAGSIAMGFIGGSRRVEVRAHYDHYPAWVAGELSPPAWADSTAGLVTAGSDRGARSVLAYDARGLVGWTARQMALLPEAPLAVASIASPLPVVAASTGVTPGVRRFDESHTYVAEASFDHAGRSRTSTLPTDPDFVGGDAPVIGGRIAYDRRGLPRSVWLDIDGAERAILASASYARDGLIETAVYGDDAGGTREATRTVMQYDRRRRPRSTTTTRSPTTAAGTRALSAVSVVLDQEFSWDRVSNLTWLTDRRPGREWAAGFRPQTVELDYDALYRVRLAMFSYTQDDGSRSPVDASSDYRAAIEGVERVDPMRQQPAASVSASASTRVVNLNWDYDFLGNMTEWSDDTESFHERSLSQITNGLDELGGRPSAIRVASSIATAAHAYSASEDRGGWLEVDYGDSGNVTAVTVHGQCRDASSTALCVDTTGTVEGRRGALRAGCVCAVEQHYQYRFDELNQIVDARRYDRPGTGSWSLQAHLRYGFDGAQQRTVKEVRDTLGATRYALWPYPGDYERRGLARGLDGYEATMGTETSYMVGGARVVWQAGEEDGALDPGHRITLPVMDLLGTSAAVIDLVSGELVEASTYYPNGARETLVTSDRNDIPLEPYGFTGKEADEEVGLTYFGMRFLMPRLARWASPDPLQIHAEGGGEAMNNYHYISGNLLQATDPIGLNAVTAADRQEQADLAAAAAAEPIVIEEKRMTHDEMVDVLHREYRRQLHDGPDRCTTGEPTEAARRAADRWATSQAYGGISKWEIVHGGVRLSTAPEPPSFREWNPRSLPYNPDVRRRQEAEAMRSSCANGVFGPVACLGAVALGYDDNRTLAMVGATAEFVGTVGTVAAASRAPRSGGGSGGGGSAVTSYEPRDERGRTLDQLDHLAYLSSLQTRRTQQVGQQVGTLNYMRVESAQPTAERAAVYAPYGLVRGMVLAGGHPVGACAEPGRIILMSRQGIDPSGVLWSQTWRRGSVQETCPFCDVAGLVPSSR